MEKSNNSIRVIAFYVVSTVFIAFMMMTADGNMIPFLKEEGLIQMLQLFGGFAGIYGVMCKCNGAHQKGAWYIIGGLAIAILGSFATAGAYFLLILITMLIGDDALWKKFDSLAKE